MKANAMPITEQAVLDALRNVEDPDLKKDLVTLNMIRNLRIDGQQVSFTVMLTTPACPMKEMLHNACATAIKTLVDQSAELDITMSAEVQEDKKNDNSRVAGIKNIIAVASGKGGVGKSTVAANLAVALKQSGAKVGLLDADIYGPSIPTLFGLEGEQPKIHDQDDKQFMEPLEVDGLQLISLGFLVPPGQSVIWRGPMASKALKQLLVDTLWDELDYLVVDLPPGTSDVHITVVQNFPLTGAVVVTTPQNIALSDVRKAIGMFVAPQIDTPVLGLVENMAWFETKDVPGKKYHLFGEGGGQQLADEYGLDLLGQIPLYESVSLGTNDGQPAASHPDNPAGKAFRDLAQRVAQTIAVQNAQQPEAAVANPAEVNA